MSFLLSLMIPAMVVNENLTFYPIVPPEAKQGWKLELFEVKAAISPHYHKVQRQFILVTEGSLQAVCTGEEPILLQKGDVLCIDPGITHALSPLGKAQFFAIDLPGFAFPEDVYEDDRGEPRKWIAHQMSSKSSLDEKYFGPRIAQPDYGVYELISGKMTAGEWSGALLEIQSSPKHVHKIETEHFIVVEGTLAIEVDGESKILPLGEMITIRPGQIHQLKSAGKDGVRVLCFSFPAFDPSDFYPVD